jgi:tetratricopeptide (TPR) repeat protein
MRRFRRSCMLTALLALGLRGTATSQETEIRIFTDLEPIEPSGTPVERASSLEEAIERDSARYDLRWQAAREYTRAAIEMDIGARKEFGYRARDHARAAISLDSAGVDGHYWLAVSAGLLADMEGGRSSIRLAAESWDEAEWVLQSDSLHAGAHHVRGRINAAVQRISSFQRFLARVLLGAETVSKTSWEGAIYHLERAAALEPQTPMHHFELAMAYRDRDRPDDMRAALEATTRAAGSGNPVVDEGYRRRARDLLDEGSSN